MDPAEATGRIFAGATAVRAASDMLEVAPAFRPDLVVRECSEFGGHLLAEKLGVPCGTLDVAPLGPVADPGVLAALNGWWQTWSRWPAERSFSRPRCEKDVWDRRVNQPRHDVDGLRVCPRASHH
jgi:hypothetical protein